MNFIVCFAITLCSWLLVEADLSWHHGHSPLQYGTSKFGPSKFSHPSYDAYRNHIKAKYYAKKAHDLAKLRSSIYGIGYGLYGYRYGSLFPKHFSPHFPLMPFIDKYPIFDLGFDDFPFFFYPYHFFFDQPHFSGISGHLTGFGYPKSHHEAQSHSHSYEYGKGYEYKKGYEYGKGHSHGHKHSQGYHKPYLHHYPSLNYPVQNHYQHPKYVKKYYPGDAIVYQSESEPDSHGYEYSYVKETPTHFKVTPPQDSIYGIRYGDHGGHDHGKFPLRDIAYDSEIIAKARPYGDVEESGREYDGDEYGSQYLSNYDDKFKDDDNLHSLSFHSGPIYDKYGSKDLIAYGSKKYEDKIKRK